MKVGSEPWKVVLLVVLLAGAGIVLYQNVLSGPTSPAAAPPSRVASPARQLRSAADELLENRAAPKGKAGARASNDFKPAFPKKGKPGEGPDPEKLDPTLRTDLLAKVQAVEYQGAERNLFQFGAAKPKLTPQQIDDAKRQAGDAADKLKSSGAPPPSEPPKPTAPPVNLKYFGYVNRPGDLRKRAFLMDGDDIVVAVEGEVIKKRYKVVRIGINSLVVEDIDFHSQQTLPLQESG